MYWELFFQWQFNINFAIWWLGKVPHALGETKWDMLQKKQQKRISNSLLCMLCLKNKFTFQPYPTYWYRRNCTCFRLQLCLAMVTPWCRLLSRFKCRKRGIDKVNAGFPNQDHYCFCSVYVLVSMCLRGFTRHAVSSVIFGGFFFFYSGGDIAAFALYTGHSYYSCYYMVV